MAEVVIPKAGGEPPPHTNSAHADQAANADKVDDLDSTTLLPGGDLPHGRTLRGNYDIRDYVAPSSYGHDSNGISFGYKLATAPTVRVIKKDATPPAECPGTVSSPEANPGYLCVYEAFAYNLYTSSYPTALYVTRNGVTLYATSPYNGNTYTMNFYTYGTWAVTGN